MGRWEILRRPRVTLLKLGINICMEHGLSLLLLCLTQTHAHRAVFLPVQTVMLERSCHLTLVHESSMDM